MATETQVLINQSTLTGIADAIRAKSNTTAQMYPNEMATKITDIPTGEVSYTNAEEVQF